MRRFFLLAAACLVELGAPAAQGQTPLFLGKSAESWQGELNDANAKVRRSAAFALGRIGEDARSAAPALARRLLQDSDAGVRDMAAAALGDIARALKDDAGDLWREASGTLVQALEKDSDAHVRRSAAYALGAFGKMGAPAAPMLRKALGDGDSSVRQNAAWALGQIGEGAGEAAGRLCECLKDKNPLVRRDAAGALGALGKAGASGVAPLIELVRAEPDEVVKNAALASLANLAGPKHEKYAGELAGVLGDKDPEVRLNAAIVLANIGGPEAGRALPVLRRALKEADPHQQETAEAALAKLGPAAEPAKLDLAEALNNPKNTVMVRRNAALALAHIGKGARSVVPKIAQALKGSEPLEVRRFAAEALAQIRYPANEVALPVIVKTIENDTEDPLVRQKCVWSLFGLKSQQKFRDCGAERALTKMLDAPGENLNLTRYDAARMLAVMLGPDAPDKTADVLLHMLKNKSLKVYNRTDANVSGASTEASSAQATVQANLGGDARYMAVEALGWLKSKVKNRKDVLDALKEASKSDDRKLSDTAKEALKELGSES